MKRLLLFALILASVAAAPRFDQWTIIGPGGGGAMFYPTISPHDPRTVLVRCDMTGIYLTHDAGAAWRMINLRTPAYFFVFDPANPDTMYAASAGLYRSTDRGRSWKLVYPAPSAVTGIAMPDDHAGVHLLTGTRPQERMTALAIDPADSKILYAGIGSELHISSDGGASWTRIASLPKRATRIFVDPKSPRNDRTVYVAGTNAVSIREHGHWREGAAPEGVEAFADISGGFPKSGGPLVVYAITPRQLVLSTDGGMSWKAVALRAGSSPRLAAVAASAEHPEVAYVSYSRLRLPGESEPVFGVARTSDTGRNWSLVWKETARQGASNIHDVWITQRFGPGWAENPISLGVAPSDPNVCYGTDYGRTMRTTDGGANWTGVYSKQTPEGFTTTGLDVTTNYGVHFDPFDHRRVFISYTDIGLFRSENGGQDWIGSTEGVPRPWVNTTYWMEFDPKVKGRVWAVMSGIHDLPRPKMWRNRGTSTYNGGVVLSEDGGRHWKVAGASLPPTAATHILLDPQSPPEARVLYIAGMGRGVFKSEDGGKNWALRNAGIEGTDPLAWRLTRDLRGALYLVVARRSEQGNIGNSGDGALYRSTDGAGHWQKLALPKGVNGPNGLTVDPGDPNRLYLAAWGREGGTDAVDGGIYLSTDAGKSWKQVFDRDRHIYDVTVDPRDPKLLYACGFESSAWRSQDRGLTWERIRGYNFKWGHRVVPDPDRPGMLYITTFGGSVWHGPAAGDPKALEDIATPEVSYNHSAIR